MPHTVLDVHILQTLPPSNINRDDTGTPKTATYGGVLRSRVSSQAWKRATRTAFADLLDSSDLGVRTKRAVAAVVERVTTLDPSIAPDAAASAAAELLHEATGVKFEVPRQRRSADKRADRDDEQALPESGYLLFLSARQIDNLAAIALRATKDPSLLKDKAIKKEAREAADTQHSVDIALFGRMVADTKDFNVDAACQVAHAISVHSVENESDYFTALDDRRTDAEPGAGMIGVVDFNASTLYRYAALDIDRLAHNLGPAERESEAPTEPTRRAVEAFLQAFITSLPTGKINTFAHQTLPEVVIVKLRTARPISFATAFEEPVPADMETGGYLRNACARLAELIPQIERTYDAQGGTETWMLRIGSATDILEPCGKTVSIRELLTQVGHAVTERLVRPQ